MRLRSVTGLVCVLVLGFLKPGLAEEKQKPNIVWIIASAASPHIGCYGESLIQTPNLDALAAESVRFTDAFVTGSISSTSRSALITGIYQTTLGAHNHRSQRTDDSGAGSLAYFDSYKLPKEVKLVPRLLKSAGYFTTINNWGDDTSLGKTDYNFVWDKSVYDGADWRKRPKGKPFFAQINLRGGDNRKADHGTDPKQVKLPPYYPDDEEMRKDWAEYLNSWVQTDIEVGEILKRLDEEGVGDNTAIFFFTDHGITHLRGEQFLWDEGLQIPLIVRLPEEKKKGTVRDDLVLQIDVSAASLGLAGVAVPEVMDGRDLFAAKHSPRKFIVSARDRSEETVDFIRCIRTKRLKLIRNFRWELSHTQPNEYKDAKPIVRHMLYLDQESLSEEELDAYRSFIVRRPPEELYDLSKDPVEMKNIVKEFAYASQLHKLRRDLFQWMLKTRDLGLIPEPILEDLGRQRGSKYYVLQQDEELQQATRRVIGLLEAGRRADRKVPIAQLNSPHEVIRFWAATVLFTTPRGPEHDFLFPLLSDSSFAVRVAGALTMWDWEVNRNIALGILAEEMRNDNPLVGLYAARGLERTGRDAVVQRPAISQAQLSPHALIATVAKRILRDNF